MPADSSGHLLLFAFAALIALEAIVTRLAGRPAYDRASTEINFGVVFGWLIFSPLNAPLLLYFIDLGNRITPVALPEGPARFAVLFLTADLIYYFWHWASHKSRWLWATHVVHHTAGRINFLAALRQGWTDFLTGTWFIFAPLRLLGFTPAECLVYFGVLHVWQLLAHNEWMGKLGPLEWFAITPSNHRVHHSLKPEHVDTNFGGLLIVWDRLFGTYADEGAERLKAFGVADGPPPGSGVMNVVLWGWYPIFRDARSLFVRRKEQ